MKKVVLEDKKTGNKKTESKETENSICPVSKKCGGCKWINKPYEEQLKMKEKWFQELMKPFCKPEPVIAMDSPMHYRNKVNATFGEDRKHNIISGKIGRASCRERV